MTCAVGLFVRTLSSIRTPSSRDHQDPRPPADAGDNITGGAKLAVSLSTTRFLRPEDHVAAAHHRQIGQVEHQDAAGVAVTAMLFSTSASRLFSFS